MHMLMVFLNIDLSATNGTKLRWGTNQQAFQNLLFFFKRILGKHCSHLFNAQISTISSQLQINWLINHLRACQTHLQETFVSNPVRQMGSIKQSKPSRWATLQKVGWAAHDDDHMDLTSHHKIIMGQPSCMCIDHSTLIPCMGFLATSFPTTGLQLPASPLDAWWWQGGANGAGCQCIYRCTQSCLS